MQANQNPLHIFHLDATHEGIAVDPKLTDLLLQVEYLNIMCFLALPWIICRLSTDIARLLTCGNSFRLDPAVLFHPLDPSRSFDLFDPS